MTESKFSSSEAIRFGWNIAKNNIGFFIKLFLILILIYGGFVFVQELTKKSLFLSIIFFIINFVVNIIVSVGLIKIALKFYDNKEVVLTDILTPASTIFKYLIGWIVYILIMASPMVFLGLGGYALQMVAKSFYPTIFVSIIGVFVSIILMIKFWFFSYFIVDKGYNPIQSLKQSFEITKGNTGKLFVFAIILSLINLLGALVLLVGLFITIPTTMIAWAFVYRKLSASVESSQTASQLSV